MKKPISYSGLINLAALLLFSNTCLADVKVGMVLDKGGKDDKSFNNAAYRGFNQAKDELKVGGKFVEATDENSFEPLLRGLASKDFDLIVAIGVSQAEAVKKVAALYPDKKFLIVDGKVSSPNVRSVLFEEQEGSYLVGVIAALTSKSGKIGFIGGMDIPLIRRFQMGYEAGAWQVNPKIEVISNYVGVTGDAWNNPPKAKELAVTQYEKGVDVIFHAAGASGAGLFDAAEEQKKLAIGCDSNQNWVKPGFVLTSMLKRVDKAVYDTINDVKNGKFTAGITKYGLKNHGIDYAVDQYNTALLPKWVQDKTNKIKADIIAGRIRVPDYYTKK